MKPGLIAFIPLLLSTAVLAQTAAKPAADPLRKYCTQLVQIPKQKGIFWQVGGDILRRMFAPKHYAQVESFMSAPLESDALIDAPQDNDMDETLATSPADVQGQNLIFSLAPIESIENPEQLKKDIAEYKKLNKAVNKMRNEQYRLRQTRNVELCIQKANEDGFDVIHFVNSLKRKFELFDAEMALQAKTLHRQFNRIHDKLKLRWTLVPVTHLDQLKAALSNPNTRNVIILQHSTEVGQLVDSARNGYPDSFFKFVSPSLRSLSVFACHTQAIRKVYSLERNLTPAGRQDRLLMTSKEFSYFGMEHVTPMEPQIFRPFLKKIDRLLAERESIKTPASVLKSVEAPACKITVDGITPSIGEFGIFVSGIYVGAIRNGKSKAEYLFPCEQIAKPGSGEDIDVRVASLAMIDKSDVTVAPSAHATLVTPSSTYEFTQTEKFDREEDKTIYSVLFSTAR